MTSSTTLMTFLVRAPPTTRSVTLLGSWDNFTKAYPMTRDKSSGPEHWTGCHSFSNIICDGEITPTTLRREGGLKMGGTYWYYYRLDDDIEFHNTTEPSTTQCPLLPGQIVNVLQVPYAFASARSRATSSASATSEHRTLNPFDKYINPRPAPKLPRLNTSPTFAKQPWSATIPPVSPWSASPPPSRGAASQPSSATTTKRFLLPRKASAEQLAEVPPSTTVSGGFRQVFRTLRHGRTNSPERIIDVGHGAVVSSTQPATGPVSKYQQAGEATPVNFSQRDRSLERTKRHIAELDTSIVADFRETRRAEETEGHLPNSSLQQRRQRSRSRGPSSLRNSLVGDENVLPPSLEVNTRPQPLDTLKEVASTQNTPMWPTTARRLSEPRLDKRLPTLPNTPSSVYPPSEYCCDDVDEDSRQKAFSAELENLESHFSSTTIATESNSIDWQTRGRFSEWSMPSPRNSTSTQSIDTSGPISPDSAVNSSDSYFMVNEKEVPASTAQQQHEQEESITPSWSSSSISSSTSLSTTDSGNSAIVREMTPTRKDSLPQASNFQHYRLPSGDHASEVTLKQFPLSSTIRPDPPAHSESMQQLLAELSYLGGVIRHS